VVFLCLYFVIAATFYAVIVWVPGTAPSLKNTVKMLGISGDALAIGILAWTALVDGYSKEKYIDEYRFRAKGKFPGWSDLDIDRRLGTWHAKLLKRTSKILEVKVGAALAAAGAIVAFVGDFL